MIRGSASAFDTARGAEQPSVFCRGIARERGGAIRCVLVFYQVKTPELSMTAAQAGKRAAVLIIDLQFGMFESNQIDPIHGGDILLRHARQLIDRAHAANVPVFYVRHGGGKGDLLEAGTAGWQIHPAISPAPGDRIIEKTTPDAFHETTLHQELIAADIGSLIVAGAQTEFCVDTTCRRARSLGFDTILVSDSHSTWDSKLLTAEQIILHHNAVLGADFVRLRTLEELDLTQFAQERI
jgi:nicotinamidase-related amidase